MQANTEPEQLILYAQGVQHKKSQRDKRVSEVSKKNKKGGCYNPR
jgi:hypothetical protein